MYIGRAALVVIGLVAVATPIVSGQAYDIEQTDAGREFEWAVRSYHNGFYQESGLSFARTVADEPSSVLARLWLAKSYYAAGAVDAAQEQYRILRDNALDSPYIRNRIEAITALQNSDLLLLPDPQYVVVQEINGQSGNRRLFSRPAGIAVDEDINIYISSFASHEVLQLSAAGRLQRNIWANRYAFDRPYAVVVDDDSILISEFGQDRVVRFNRAGTQEIRFTRAGIHGRLAGPQYLAVDEAKNIYVSDWGNQRIVKFNSNGNFIYEFSRRNIPRRPVFSPTGIVYHEELLYIANTADQTIVVSDQNGNYVRTITLDDNPLIEGLALFDADRLLIATRDGILTYHVRTEVLRRITPTAEQTLTSLAIDANDTIYATDFDKNRILVFSPVDQVYGGLVVHTLGVDATAFPRVTVDVSVRNRFGKPIVGLRADNFTLHERTTAPVVSLAAAESALLPPAIMLVVPLTERTEQIAAQLQSFVAELLAVVGEGASVGIVFSGAEAILQGELGVPFVRLRNYLSTAWWQRIINASGAPPPATERALDAAVSIAAAELFDSPAKRTIIYINDGSPIAASATLSNRQQLAQALSINGVSFIEVAFASDSAPAEPVARYPAANTYRFAYADSNVTDRVVDTIRTIRDGRYRLSYISGTNDDFGRQYIPLSVEAFLYQRSGRDELGYYAR